MARLVTCGFEQQQVSQTSNEAEGEGFAVGNGGSAGPTIDTSVKRSGAAALKCAKSNYAVWNVVNTNTPDDSTWYYWRAYFRFDANPGSASIRTLWFTRGTGGWALSLRTDGKLVLCEGTAVGGTQIGSLSSALSTGTWYRLEVGFQPKNAGGSQSIVVRLDGATLIETTANIGSGVLGQFVLGDSQNSQTPNQWFDDVAVNDSSGSAQNSWARDGSIVLSKAKAPNLGGWALSFAGDTQYLEVSNVPPKGASTPTANSQTESSASNTTDSFGPILDTPAAAGMASGTRITVAQAIAQIGSVDTTPRSVKIDMWDGSAYTGGTAVASPSAAIGSSPANWKTIRGAVAYSPSYPTRTDDAYVKVTRQTSGGKVYCDFAAALFEYASPFVDQGVAVPVFGQATKTQGVAVPVVADVTLGSLSCDYYGRVSGTVTVPTGCTSLKVYRSTSSGGTYADITSNCVISGSAPSISFVDKRPAYGSQAIALNATGYYKVAGVFTSPVGPLSSVQSCVSATDREQVERAEWSTMHTEMAVTTNPTGTVNTASMPSTVNVGSTTGHGTSGVFTLVEGSNRAVISYSGSTSTSFTGCAYVSGYSGSFTTAAEIRVRENSTHLAYANPGRLLLSAAWIAATYSDLTTQALTDLDTWWTYTATQINSDGVFSSNYRTGSVFYSADLTELIVHLVGCVRLLRRLAGNATADAVRADMIAKADAMGVRQLALSADTLTGRGYSADWPKSVSAATAWAGSTAMASGVVRKPTSGATRIYRNINPNGGTTGASEPTWPTTTRGCVQDGTVVWQECTTDTPVWSSGATIAEGDIRRPTGSTTPITRTGTVTSGSNVITGLSTTSDLQVGSTVSSGLGTITAILSGTSIQVTNNAGISTTLSLTFTPPSPPAATYRALNAGTTGGTEPTWPSSYGDTVTDNGITWKETGHDSRLSLFVTYSKTSPYNPSPAYPTQVGSHIGDDQARAAAALAVLYTDPEATHFYTGGSSRSTALTRIQDSIRIGTGHQVGDGALTQDTLGYLAYDSLYASFTIHLTAIALYQMGVSVLPELQAYVLATLRWFDAYYSTEPTIGNADELMHPATGIESEEFGWRSAAYTVMHQSSPIEVVRYTSAFWPDRVYVEAGQASATLTADMHFLSATAMSYAFGLPQTLGQSVAVAVRGTSTVAVAVPVATATTTLLNYAVAVFARRTTTASVAVTVNGPTVSCSVAVPVRAPGDFRMFFNLGPYL